MNTVAAPPGPRWIPSWTRDQGRARATSLFTSTFKSEPTGVWSVPGRVNIIGEHTDYNRGLALPTVLPHRTYVAARRREDHSIRVVSDQSANVPGPDEVWHGTLETITPSSVDGWPAYVAGVLWALQEHGFSGPGLDLAISSCIPVGSGLASSAALSCSTALAVNDLWKLALDNDNGRIELAEACLDGDTLVAGSPAGGLDQHTALRCSDGEALLMDFNSQPPTTSRCPLYFPDYGLALLIIDTTEGHDVTDGKFAQRRFECERAARELGVATLRDLDSMRDANQRVASLTDQVLMRRARHVTSENGRTMAIMAELSGTAPAHERFDAIGRALSASHESLNSDFEVSTPALNTVVRAAIESGALGARMIGAGFGGSALALIRRPHAERTAVAIHQAALGEGHPAPRFLLV